MSVQSIETLLSLPPAMARAFGEGNEQAVPRCFAASDPPGIRLGSGGGTASLLVAAYRGQGRGQTFRGWLTRSRKLLLHGGGQSRRLPAYAPVGKPLLPLPVDPTRTGQRLGQTLLDFQLPLYERAFRAASQQAVVMVASGDVLLRFGSDLPPFPEADVVALGMKVSPEVAQHFGVFFLAQAAPERLAFFLQKPSVAHIRDRMRENPFLVDTGMWLLSERAVQALMKKCGWDETTQRFQNDAPAPYELYAEFGLALGDQPTAQDGALCELSCAVVALPQPEFTHLGTSRQMIETVQRFQHAEENERFGLTGTRQETSRIAQNADVQTFLRPGEQHTLWIENATVPATWELTHDHVVTGVPENDWKVRLEPGVCLDFVPVGERAWSVRAYGIDDAFRGALADAETLWFGRAASEWFARREMAPSQADIDGQCDVQLSRLFPVVEPEALDSRFLNWLLASEPEADRTLAERWCALPRLSAQELSEQANVTRLLAQRQRHLRRNVAEMVRGSEREWLARLDLEATAHAFARTDLTLPAADVQERAPLARVHETMFRSAVERFRQESDWKRSEDEAFHLLREALIQDARLSPAHPVCNVLEDQIVWARSPVRLDLAGGWTDTPPYCLEHGGKVVNLAVNLNGQPPVQVFAKRTTRPEIVIRSIDLGVEDRVRTYEELDTYVEVGSEFALAKAALAMCGFLPRFHAEGGVGTLARQLEAFGGGLELSMVAAVPAGSGLGTSSILASTLLGALNELCGLNWDRFSLMRRTLVVEQMLTTGGGWQDQAGALFPGIKLLETPPGLSQKPTVRWLPEYLFAGEYAQSVNLLYYTGLTRLAKNILHEIVRGMFLNAAQRLEDLRGIGENALNTFEAIQRADREALCRAVRTSWELNQRLDAGTNPSAVQSILDRIEEYAAGAKLLGAGGGGYLLILAKDPQSALRIRQTLEQNPPNARARFVEFSLSRTGLEVTRS